MGKSIVLVFIFIIIGMYDCCLSGMVRSLRSKMVYFLFICFFYDGF